MLTAFAVVISALVDILYAFLDPRIRLATWARDCSRFSRSRPHGLVRDRGGHVRAVDDVSFTVTEGEVVAIVGESGSGKSVTAMSLMGLTRGRQRASRAGDARWRELLSASDEGARRSAAGDRDGLPGPDELLNPVYTIGDQIVEEIRAHEPEMSQGRRRSTARSS